MFGSKKRNDEETKDLLKDKTKPNLIDKGEQDNYKDSDSKVVYAFVVFRSMEGVRLLRSAYNYTWWQRMMTKCCCKSCDKGKLNIDSLTFKEHYLNVDTAILPDNILWNHLGYSKCSLLMRQIFQFFLGLFFLTISLYATIEIAAY